MMGRRRFGRIGKGWLGVVRVRRGGVLAVVVVVGRAAGVEERQKGKGEGGVARPFTLPSRHFVPCAPPAMYRREGRVPPVAIPCRNPH